MEGCYGEEGKEGESGQKNENPEEEVAFRGYAARGGPGESWGLWLFAPLSARSAPRRVAVVVDPVAVGPDVLPESAVRKAHRFAASGTPMVIVRKTAWNSCISAHHQASPNLSFCYFLRVVGGSHDRPDAATSKQKHQAYMPAMWLLDGARAGRCRPQFPDDPTPDFQVLGLRPID